MTRGAKIREIMEQEGFKAKNQRELLAKVKEIKQRLKEQDKARSLTDLPTPPRVISGTLPQYSNSQPKRKFN
jgi:hypothetical protein